MGEWHQEEFRHIVLDGDLTATAQGARRARELCRQLELALDMMGSGVDEATLDDMQSFIEDIKEYLDSIEKELDLWGNGDPMDRSDLRGLL